jgi:hypothetical protein
MISMPSAIDFVLICNFESQEISRCAPACLGFSHRKRSMNRHVSSAYSPRYFGSDYIVEPKEVPKPFHLLSRSSGNCLAVPRSSGLLNAGSQEPRPEIERVVIAWPSQASRPLPDRVRPQLFCPARRNNLHGCDTPGRHRACGG